ncbi:(2Fe-2S)-binding protein [Lachnospiraceae bacterium JLR.KK008]
MSERKVTHMDYDKIVCNCLGVTNGMIKEAVDGGADTLEQVQEATGAGTVCGACLEDVRHLVEQFVSERKDG